MQLVGESMANAVKHRHWSVFPENNPQILGTAAILAADFIGHSGSMQTAAVPPSPPQKHILALADLPTKWAPK